MDARLMCAGFGKNRKTTCWIKGIGNEMRSEHLKNNSKDFLQTHYLNTFLHVFLECNSCLLQKN